MEIPELLKNGGCSVDVFCIANSWAIQNKAHDRWIEGPEGEEPFINQLLQYITTNGSEYDWIIPGDDAIIRLLNERIDNESDFYKILPLTKIENRELLGSKAGFSKLCKKYNITTPKYLIYTPNSTPNQIGGYMSYPLLMKLDKSEGGFGVFLCENETDLAKKLTTTVNKENLVFQQFIKGYDVNVEVLYKNGKLLVYSYSRTLTIMGKFGVSTQRLFYQNPEIEPELIKMGENLGLNGFGNVVFMYSEAESKHYLIEIDVRPNAWMNYGKYMGNDFSEGVRNIINGSLRLVKPADTTKQPLKISLYKKDVYRCILEKDFKGLLAWLTNKEGRWRYIPINDSKLFRACTSYLIKNFWDFAINKIKKVFRLALKK
jgi:predicted ATP-grasp superfamily ATP-dependent carboligase